MRRLDYEDCLKVTFKILEWICDNSSFKTEDRINNIMLSLDLIFEIGKLSSMQSMRDLIK
jgi:hypothetical protein